MLETRHTKRRKNGKTPTICKQLCPLRLSDSVITIDHEAVKMNLALADMSVSVCFCLRRCLGTFTFHNIHCDVTGASQGPPNAGMTAQRGSYSADWMIR